MRRSLPCLLVILLATSLGACRKARSTVALGGQDASTEDAAPAPASCSGCTVIRHVRVVDAAGVRTDRTVAIDGERILFDADEAGPVVGATEEIDGTGESLLPGLW